MLDLATYQPHCHPHVLLLGPTDDYLERALRLEIAVTVLTEEHRLTSAQEAFLRDGNLVDFFDMEAVLARAASMAEAREIAAVVSFTEFGTLPAAIVAATLGVPGPALSTTVHCRDKLIMRMKLGQDLCNVPYAWVTCVDELARFRARHGDVVVKPRNGTGSCEVMRIASTEPVPEIIVFPVLAEKYIAGPEYSCETFSFRGMHHLLAVTEKFLGGESGLVERGHRIGTDDGVLSEAMRAQLFALLDKLGIQDGPAHTEIKICKDRMYLIETHNRPGGDRIWQLVEEARHFSLVQATIRGLLGIAPNIASLPNRCACIHYPEFEAGKVAAVRIGLCNHRDGVVWHKLEIEPNQVIQPWQQSSDRHGAFIVAADDIATLAAMEAKARASIQITVSRQAC